MKSQAWEDFMVFVSRVSFALAFILCCAGLPLAAVIDVPTDQPTIQAGVDAASPGDTVCVWPGTYYEHVLVSQSIHLIGTNKHVTAIDAGTVGSCIRIKANRVEVRGFTLLNSGGEEIFDLYSDAGIRISDSDSCLISQCVVRNHPVAGIHIGAGSYNRIEYCTIYAVPVGIRIGGEHMDSVVTWQNEHNEILHNYIGSCPEAGIHFVHGLYASYTEVRGNGIYGNATGLRMYTSEQNEISYNLFMYNTGQAIFINHCMCGGDKNQFHHNAFVGNWSSPQCGDDGLDIEYWYDTLSNEGNYWSDYSGTDGDGDGVGDTPYLIDLYSPRGDPFPLMAILDDDADGYHDSVDNCPGLYNPDQADGDGDFVGDLCDDCTDYDGDGYSNAGIPGPGCPQPDNCDYFYNPDQEDIDGDGIGDSCDVRPLSTPILATACTQLVVTNNGNFGYCENDEDGKANLDYYYAGDCDQSAVTYLYGGSPVICYVDGVDTVVDRAVYFPSQDKQKFRTPGWGNPEIPLQTQPGYQYYGTGAMATHDFRIGLDVAWWAPQQLDTCPFVIQAIRVYSFDGDVHEGVSVGQVIDWDVPGDHSGDNTGGIDSLLSLVYQRGVESEGQGCQPNDNRFGGQAFLTMTLNDTCFGSGNVFGAHVRPNSGNIWSGASPSAWYDNMHVAGYSASDLSTDQHTMMTFLADYDITPDDTLTIYSVLTSVMNGDENELRDNVMAARQWFQDHVASLCRCCLGSTGDIDGNGVGPDIADLVWLVNYMFNGGPMPPCLSETDVDGNSGGPNIADLVYLVNYMFSGGPAPADCNQ
ncbi:MAG: right-handed parallel beta-helix repeat-containing protein [bacterium]